MNTCKLEIYSLVNPADLFDLFFLCLPKIKKSKQFIVGIINSSLKNVCLFLIPLCSIEKKSLVGIVKQDTDGGLTKRPARNK